ncbi:hypothetical protein ACIPSJ_51210 [Streptomyces sp. NPDC090088]|uniref:hypothetical protein n=1 Tax=Streptomyces sp. NPDC090088 TaxID=3365944 RepID=UPI0038273728
MVREAGGTLLAIVLAGGSRHGITRLLPLLGVIQWIGGVAGRPCGRLRWLFAGRGYGFGECRRRLWKRVM